MFYCFEQKLIGNVYPMFLLAQGERHLHIYGSNRDDIFFLLTLDRQNIKRDASVDNFNFNFASLEFVFEAIFLKKI